MEEVFIVKKENVDKAIEVLKKDEKTSMLSIVIRQLKNLGFESEDFCIYVSGLEEYVKKAKELLKNIAEISKEKEKIIEKIKEEEQKAFESFGSLFS